MRSTSTATGMRLPLPAVAGLPLLAGCGGGAAATPSVAASPAARGSSAGAGASSSPSAQPNLDDLTEDGTPDPTSGTQDFGAGLVLLISDNLFSTGGPDLNR